LAFQNVTIGIDGDGISLQFGSDGPRANIDKHLFQTSDSPASNGSANHWPSATYNGALDPKSSVVDFYKAHGRGPSLSSRERDAEDWGIQVGALGSYERNIEVLKEAFRRFGDPGMAKRR